MMIRIYIPVTWIPCKFHCFLCVYTIQCEFVECKMRKGRRIYARECQSNSKYDTEYVQNVIVQFLRNMYCYYPFYTQATSIERDYSCCCFSHRVSMCHKCSKRLDIGETSLFTQLANCSSAIEYIIFRFD